MRRSVRIVVSIAAVAASATIRAEEPKKQPIPASPTQSFFVKFLNPRMAARISVNAVNQAAAAESRYSNPFTHDPAALERVERGAIRATKSAIKRYAIEQLGLDGWSVPLVRTGASGVAAYRTDSGGTRLRFGFSHRAPRAEVLFQRTAGRISLSADAYGRIGTTFETPTSSLRLGVNLDPVERQATFGIVTRF